MIRFVLLMLLGINIVLAAEDCNYDTTSGLEFQFSEKPSELQHYGYQTWNTRPDVGSLPYANYVGRRGKILETTTMAANGIFLFKNVLLENCQHLYVYEPLLASSKLTDIRLLAGTWVSSTVVDPMTDRKSCSVTPKSEMPFPIFHYLDNGEVSVAVVGGDFPGKDVSFRIGKEKAISEPEIITGARAQKLIQQIRSGGQSLLVGSYKWPQDIQEINDFKLEGIVPQLDKCTSEVRK